MAWAASFYYFKVNPGIVAEINQFKTVRTQLWEILRMVQYCPRAICSIDNHKRCGELTVIMLRTIFDANTMLCKILCNKIQFQ